MKTLRLLLLTPLFIAPLVNAASFDCAKASTQHEKMVCADKTLSAMDDTLGATYKTAVKQTPQPLRATLRDWQQQWLQSLRACADSACLKDKYQSQIIDLSQVSASAPTGIYQRYAGKKPDSDSAKISIIALGNGKAYVEGNAVWVFNAKTGSAHVGDLDGLFPLVNQRIDYADDECKVTLTFKANALVASDTTPECGGLNVTFNGDYRKVK